MLVGPSGIGKDVMIDQTRELIETTKAIPVLGGKTIDHVKAEMLKIGSPAACYIAAPELTAFLGGKDYQKSMVQELTDLLSTGNKCDVSTKGEGKQIIPFPTVTMHAGTTGEWLARAMPDGSLEGGFLPRFVIVCEEYSRKHVAWVKYETSRMGLIAAQQAKAKYSKAVKNIVAEMCGKAYEMIPSEGAKDFYRNWYGNRFSYFSAIVRPYANRSRDHIHRLAMLMALTCGRRHLEEVDYQFAAEVIAHVAVGIDRVIAPIVVGQRRIRR